MRDLQTPDSLLFGVNFNPRRCEFFKVISGYLQGLADCSDGGLMFGDLGIVDLIKPRAGGGRSKAESGTPKAVVLTLRSVGLLT